MSRLPIEPLDSARWERIERSLEDRLHEARVVAPRPATERWRALVALGAIAAAAAIVVLWEVRAPRGPVPVAVTHIETEGAPSHVNIGGSSLDVAAHSAARISGTDESGVVVALDHGTVECEVTPRHERPPFIVRAGDVTVRVVGTHFRVEHDSEATHVSVERGVVEVDQNGMTTVVGAGSVWPTPKETTVPEPAPTTASSGAAHKGPLALVPAVTAAPASPRDRYDRALALEASHPDEALALYQEVARGDGPWAMNALYAAGRFELERGNKDIARTLFAEYLRRFPAGPNAGDARDLSAKLK